MGHAWTETKNVNSLRSVERAIRSEIILQAEVLDGGGTITQERDAPLPRRPPATQHRAREKSDAEDYRQFPEPDLIPPPSQPGRWNSCGRVARGPEPSALGGCRRSGALSDFDMLAVVKFGAVDVVVATGGCGSRSGGARSGGGLVS